MSHFLLFEGLAGLVHNVVSSLGEFKGFKVNEEFQFELLHFADDVVVVCEGSRIIFGA